MRKDEQARKEMVKDVNGQILRDGVEVRTRWAEYFEQVLNVADAREANINVVGNWWMPVFGDLNGRSISLEEVGEAVNEMKSGKAPGLDGFPLECICIQQCINNVHPSVNRELVGVENWLKANRLSLNVS